MQILFHSKYLLYKTDQYHQDLKADYNKNKQLDINIAILVKRSLQMFYEAFI